MPKRLKKYLRRLLYLVVILAVLAIGAFWYFCHSPLEGSVEEMGFLVPRTAEFMLRGSYEDLKATGWVQANVLSDPLHPSIREQLHDRLPQMMAETFQSLHQQDASFVAEYIQNHAGFSASGFADDADDTDVWSLIRLWQEWVTRDVPDGADRVKLAVEIQEGFIASQIPLGLISIDAEEDGAAGEVVVAGRLCERLGIEHGAPRWREILLLKRLPWKPRAGLAAVLGHEWIRDMVVDPSRTRISPEGDNGVYKVLLTNVRPSPERDRAGCSAGFVIPPENVWYLMRIKDVIALSNSPDLIDDVANLATNYEEGQSGQSFIDRPDFDVKQKAGHVALAAQLDPLHTWGHSVLAEVGEMGEVLNRFLTIASLDKATNGSLSLQNEDMLVGRVDVEYMDLKLAPEVESKVYRLQPQSVRKGLAELVPAEDTWLVAMLRADPMHFFNAILLALPDGDRTLIENNLRGTKYNRLEDVLHELAPRLDDTAAVAIARLSDLMDKQEFATWASKEDENPVEIAAFMMRISEATNQDELNKFLEERIEILGFSDEIQTKTHGDFTYSRITPKAKFRDFKLITPCYILAQDHFIFALNETYFRKILDTMADPQKRSLAQDEAFRFTMEPLQERGHLGIFVDLEKLFRVPPDSEPGSQPRGHMWDRRNLWVQQAKDEREEGIQYRQELERKKRQEKGGQALNDQELMYIDEQVIEYMRGWQDRMYPEYVEEYRKSLLQWRRLHGIGLVATAYPDQSKLELSTSLLLREAEAYAK